MNLQEFGALGPGEVWGVPGDAEPSLQGSGRAEMELLGRSFRTRLRVWSMANPFQILGDPPAPPAPSATKFGGVTRVVPNVTEGSTNPPRLQNAPPHF